MNAKLCVDLRWINCSGVGTYIKGIMPGLVENLPEMTIAGLGPKERLAEFPWSHARNFEIIHSTAARYSLQEQITLPWAIPGDTSLFFSPHYPIPLLYRGRLIVTVHDLSHLVVPEIANNRIKRRYAETMLRAVRKRAAVILTVSQFSKSELLRYTTGPDENNIVPIHEGVSGEWYRAAQASEPPDRPYVIYVGNVKPYKNVGRLVEAFLQVLDRIPHDLVIVGQHEGLITGESGAFFSLVRQAGRRVRLTGFVTQQKLLELVGHAAASILPSLYEGFGFPPVEAMAAGVPALVSRVASLPEVCGDAALYCDPYSPADIAERLVEIVSDDGLRSSLIRRGKERARRYSWDTCARKTVEAIRSVLSPIPEPVGPVFSGQLS